MRVVYKYPIILQPMSNICKVEMPHDAKILTANCQGDMIYIWAEVDTESTVQTKTFEVFGTGHELMYDPRCERKYIETVFMTNGLVFHIYQR